MNSNKIVKHDDVINWKHFPRYWPFVRGIHRSPVNSPHKGQWRGALMFSLICVWINGWVNNGETGDLRRHRPHYDVIVMQYRNDNMHKSITIRWTVIMTALDTKRTAHSNFVAWITVVEIGNNKKYHVSICIQCIALYYPFSISGIIQFVAKFVTLPANYTLYNFYVSLSNDVNT